MDVAERDRVRALVARAGGARWPGRAAYPLATLRARAAELERRITEAPDEGTAREAADELHALLDGVENVDELPGRARPRADRAVRAVRVLRRAVRGRRLSRRQAAMLDRLLAIVANEDAVLLALAGVGRPRAGGGR